MTIPPTINWFDEQVTPTGRWQVAPPIGTDRMRTLISAPDGGTLASSPYSTENMNAAPNANVVSNPLNKRGVPPMKAPGASLAGIDPFAWWSSHANGRKPLPPTPPVAPRRNSLRLALSSFQAHPKPDQQGRRKVITLTVAGVAAAGALTVGSITFAHLTQSIKQPTQLANMPKMPTTPAPTTGHTSAKPTAKPTRAPTKAATKAPTHTGTVIGATTMAMNSAHVFTNPADGVSSLLIRLNNGNFVSCERTCTHQGVAVNYDTQTRMILCPAHGAIFDPQNGFNHVSGPGNGPLTHVTIHVNGDGTVTTG